MTRRPIDTTTITLTSAERIILSHATTHLSDAAINRLHAHLGGGRSASPDEEPAPAALYDPILCAGYFAAVSIARRCRRQLDRVNFFDDDTGAELTLYDGEAAVLAQAVSAYLASDTCRDERQQALACKDSHPEMIAICDRQHRDATSLAQRLSEMR